MLADQIGRFSASRINAVLRRTATPFVLVSRPQARFFFPGPITLEAAEIKENKAAKNKKSADEAPSAAKPGGKAKAESEHNKVVVPRQWTNAPGYGPTDYSHWFTKYFLPTQRPLTSKEDVLAVSKAAGEAYKAITKEESQKIHDEAFALRKEALKTRQEWINQVPQVILKELNRRRSEQGKRLLHKTVPRTRDGKRPYSSFLRYMLEFQRKESESNLSLMELAKAAGMSWRNMSETEKAPYVNAYRSALAEYNARPLNA